MFEHSTQQKKARKRKYEKKYPKLVALFLTLIIAYILFYERESSMIILTVSSLGTLGVFIAGMLFTYGFTSGPATALLIIMGEQHHSITTALIGGLGALIADLTIFTIIRTTMVDELHRVEREPAFHKVKKLIPRSIRHYLLPVIGGLIIASPLPDEIGVALLAGTKTLHPATFMIISYTMNTIGIYILLTIGSAL